MGIREILTEWTAFRTECIERRTYFDLTKKKEKLHLLEGLAKILLDIDKAVKIIRETEFEEDVIPNLMTGFGIDEIQAEYVAEIKLRNINRQYILKRTEEIEQLRADIAEMEEILRDKSKVRAIIIKELKEVVKNYKQPRKTMLCYNTDTEYEETEDDIPNYPVNIFITKSGYFKKITPQSLRMSSEHKLKEGDYISQNFDTFNKSEIIFITDRYQAYKTKISAFDCTKASVMGDYIPAKLGFDEGESLVTAVITSDYSGYILFVYENGKIAKVPLKSYETKTNRKKLANAYSNKSALAKILFIPDDTDILIRTDGNRAVLCNTSLITPKAKHIVNSAEIVNADEISALEKFRINTFPAVGLLAKNLPESNQLSFE